MFSPLPSPCHTNHYQTFIEMCELDLDSLLIGHDGMPSVTASDSNLWSCPYCHCYYFCEKQKRCATWVSFTENTRDDQGFISRRQLRSLLLRHQSPPPKHPIERLQLYLESTSKRSMGQVLDTKSPVKKPRLELRRWNRLLRLFTDRGRSRWRWRRHSVDSVLSLWSLGAW